MMLKKFKSPFLISVLGVLANRAHLFMMMAFQQGGNLGYHIREKKLKLYQVKTVTAEVLLGLVALHEHNIIYRDLKP